MATEFNHGIRIVEAGEDSRPLATFDQTAIGAVVTAPDADAQIYPLNEPILLFTHEVEKQDSVLFHKLQLTKQEFSFYQILEY